MASASIAATTTLTHRVACRTSDYDGHGSRDDLRASQHMRLECNRPQGPTITTVAACDGATKTTALRPGRVPLAHRQTHLVADVARAVSAT